MVQMPTELNYSKKQVPKTKFIHAMGQFIDMETGPDLSASQLLQKLGLVAHYLIDPSGSIIELLDYRVMGAHAKGFNSGTVGIEFLVPGLHTLTTLYEAMKSEWASVEQLMAGARLCAWLESKGVTGWERHDKADPSRKKDPGEGFPYRELQRHTKDYLSLAS